MIVLVGKNCGAVPVGVGVDVAGTVVAVGGGNVGVGCASNVIATAVGMKSEGRGEEIAGDAELFDLQDMTPSRSTRISCFIQAPEPIIIAVIIAACPSVCFQLRSHHKLPQVK